MTAELKTDDLIDGRFRIVRKLGEGGMSVVFAAHDTARNAPVAVKVLSERATSSFIEDVIRFKREVELVSKLDHANIVKMYGAGDFGDTPYLVTELLDGQSLSDFISVRQIFSRSDALKIMLQIAEGLSYVHANGIVHRDLKPGNIMVRWADGMPSIKLLDFGLSLILELGQITDEAEVVGTFAYMSPEATGIVNKRVDERSDLYSLGVIFYQLITGETPFKGRDVSTILHQHVTVVPEPPSRLNPDVVEVLDRIVMKLLAKDSDLRYQSAKGLIHDLKRAAAGERDFAVGEKDQKVKLTYQTRMIGREAELEDISHLIRKAERRSGSTILIAGDAGVGKSRLIEEVRAYAYRRDAVFIGARCANQESKTPYQPFRDAINEYIKALEQMEEGERGREIDRLREEVGDLGGILLKLNPRMGKILGECKAPVALDPDRENQRFLMVASRFFCGIAPEGSVAVLYIEDLHWADEGTLALLAEIHEIGADANLVLIASYREDELAADHLVRRLEAKSDVAGQLRAMKLAPLTAEHLRKVIVSIFGESVQKADVLARFLHEKSGGNPFFAITILREFVEEKAVVWERDAWNVTWERLSTVSIGASMIEMILKRAHALPPAANRMLGIASVYGRDFDMDLLFKLTDLGTEDIVHLVDDAINLQFLVEDAERGRLLFAHDRIRDAFYRKLDAPERRRLHGEMGRYIEHVNRMNIDSAIFDLVYHYHEGEDFDKVLEFVLPAAKRAKESSANDAALRYYQMAVDLLEARGDKTSGRWIQAKEGLVEIYLLVGASNDAIAAAREILPLKQTPLEKTRIYYHMGNAWFNKGDWAQCEQAFAEGLALLGEKIPRTKGQVIVSLVRGLFVNLVRHNVLRRIWPQRRYSEQAQEETKEICRIVGKLTWMYILDDALKCMNLVIRSYNISHARLDNCREKSLATAIYAAIFMSIPMFSRSLAYHHKALAMRTALGDEWGIGQCLQFLGFCHSLMGRHEKAIQSFQQSRDVFTTLGDMWEYGMVLDGWSRVYLYLGDYQRMISLASQYQGISEKTANDFGVASAEALLAFAYVEKGNYAKAEALGGSALRRSDARHIGIVQCFSRVHLGYLECERQQWDEALRHLEDARALYEKHMFIRDQTVFLYTLLAEARIGKFKSEAGGSTASGRRRELARIRALCRTAVAKTKPWANHHGRALRIQGEYFALAGDLRGAERRFRQAIEQTEYVGRKFELAKSHLALGVLLEARGDTREAAIAIERATGIFRDIGAKDYSERADHVVLADIRTRKDATETETPRRRLKMVREMNAIISAARHLSSILDLDELLVKIMDCAMEFTGAETGVLLLYPDDPHASRVLDPRVVRSMRENAAAQEGHPFSRSLLKRVEETREAVLIDDVQVDERAGAEISRVDRELRSVLVSPILARGELIGAIHLDSRLVGGLFTKEDVRVMELIGGQAGISIENARLYRMAVLDGMTRLYNRTFLEHSLIQGIAAARRYNKKLSVVMSDIDRFKHINDNLGHAAGDAVIKGVADVIRNASRKSDLAARFGGDEFVIVLQETDKDQGSVFAENIRKLVQEIRLPAGDAGAKRFVVSISLGIAECCDTDDAAALLAKADTALYKSKAQGGNRVSAWEEGDQTLQKNILPR